jgi:uncharacterized protein (DUF1330 family)
VDSGHFIDPTREAFEFFKSLPRDEPIWMLNQVKFRPVAIYPEGHADAGLGRTGVQAYGEYGLTSQPIFARVGGTIMWRGQMQAMLTGPQEEAWDTIFIAHYPAASAFFAMITDPDYKLAVVHRQAAVLTSRLVRCQQMAAGGGFG